MSIEKNHLLMRDLEESARLADADETDSDSGTTGTSGGASGEVRFHYKDVLEDTPRDDLLAVEEITRLLAVHKEVHKERVDHQKNIRKERQAVNEGKLMLAQQIQNQRGVGYGQNHRSAYKSHPITNRAQFSGMNDLKVSAVPSQYDNDTNAEKQEELDLRFELQNRYNLTNKPSFNPKPRPR